MRRCKLYEQPVQALHELRRIAELAAFRQLRLLVEEQRQLLEALAVGEAVEMLHQRMPDIELERRLRLRNLLACGLENAPHAGADIVLTQHQTRRRLGEAG